MKYLLRTASLLMLLTVVSCQTARELHYFREGDNYYRLRVKEKSIASKSRYLCGYFDEHAVDKYFSEPGQPDSARVVEWLNNPGQNNPLVMILSTNSNAVSEQIGSFANNEELLEIVAQLSNKDKIALSNSTTIEFDNLKTMASNIASSGDAYFLDATTDNVKGKIQDFLENIKANMKGKIPLENMGTAITKYQTP